jgi:anhydro-N-acetylmuramic acid kinase
MRDFKVIGLMSGSSLDGVDIAYVNFSHDNKTWFFQIVEAGNVPYSEYWKEQLSLAFNKDKEELKELDKEYGRYLGTITQKFIKKYDMEPKLIASHGHTIFHRPEEGFTLQIGDGQEIANATGIMTINDFRTEDVEKGGQGAPLVPIGDRHLFAEYPICLKRRVIRTTPEGVVDNYYKATWEALEQFREENNGRCPHFKEKQGFLSSIGKAISNFIRKE